MLLESNSLKPLSGGVRYIEEVERNQDSLTAKDAILARLWPSHHWAGWLPYPGNGPRKASSGHLHRIEVLTFDQLMRIAGRVLSLLEDKLRSLAVRVQSPRLAGTDQRDRETRL